MEKQSLPGGRDTFVAVSPSGTRNADAHRRPEIEAAISAGAAEALETVQMLLRDTTVSAKVRADIGFKWLDRAGDAAPRAGAPRGAEIPLHEMSVAELRDLAAVLGAEIADRAKPVNTPQTPAIGTHVIESLM